MPYVYEAIYELLVDGQFWVRTHTREGVHNYRDHQVKIYLSHKILKELEKN